MLKARWTELLGCMVCAVSLSLLSGDCDEICVARGGEWQWPAVLVGFTSIIAIGMWRGWEMAVRYYKTRQFRPVRAQEFTEGVFTVGEEEEDEEQGTSAQPAPAEARALYDGEKIWSHVFGVGVANFFMIYSLQLQSTPVIFASTTSWVLVLALHYFEGGGLAAQRGVWRRVAAVLQVLLGAGCTVVIVVDTAKRSATSDSSREGPAMLIAVVVPFLFYNAATSHAFEHDLLANSSPVTVIVALCGIAAVAVTTGLDAFFKYFTSTWFRGCNTFLLSPLFALGLLHTTVELLRRSRLRLAATSLILGVSVNSRHPVSIGLACGGYALAALDVMRS